MPVRSRDCDSCCGPGQPPAGPAGGAAAGPGVGVLLDPGARAPRRRQLPVIPGAAACNVAWAAATDSAPPCGESWARWRAKSESGYVTVLHHPPEPVCQMSEPEYQSRWSCSARPGPARPRPLGPGSWLLRQLVRVTVSLQAGRHWHDGSLQA